jgi:Mg2+-importing ATPase
MRDLLSYKIDNLVREFNSSLDKGLTTNQYHINFDLYGKNRILKEEYSVLKIFLAQFNIFVFLLIFSSLFSYFLQEYIDALFIIGFVLLNVVLGFFQEYRSEKTAKLLEKYSNFSVLVLRDGKEYILDHEDLVPGDIVEIKAGDIVPADIKIFESNDLFMNESIISGESKPVFKSTHQVKDADPILLSGTSVIKGFARGIVVYTGKDSRIGHISKLSTSTESESVYEKEAKKLSNFIFKLVAVSLSVATSFNYFFNFQDTYKFILYSIALAVTVIPEALPLVITFSLSNGALKLYKNKVLVKRLTAIEDLGGIEVLCSDKTGTLTENRLKIAETISLNHFDLGKLAYMSVSQVGEPDSFDVAILEHFKLSFKYNVLSEIPFDPIRRRSSRLVSYNDKKHLIIKGAFETLSKFDLITQTQKQKLIEFNAIESAKGRRVLVFGHTETTKATLVESDEKKITICGAISFEDPIRFTAIKSISKAESLNVDVRILTGDSKEIAFYVAEKVGLVKSIEEVVSSEDMNKFKGEELRELIFKTKVFCRVSPEEKYQIIKTLQHKYQVGYLGDGINDAPSLKVANVGIAVSNSSDIAKSSADIILTKKSLEVLIDGILEGRIIFYNITKYIKITISSNFGNYFAMLFSVFFVPFLPLKPIQILLLNFVSDVPLMSVSTDNVDEIDLKKPSRSNFEKLLRVVIVMGLISTIFDFIVFFYFRTFGESVLQSSWFLTSVLTEILIIFSLRTPQLFFKGPKPSFILGLVSVLTISLTFASIFYSPLSNFFGFVALDVKYLYVVISLVLSYFIISELVKIAFFRNGKKLL